MKFEDLPREVLGHIFESFTYPVPQAASGELPAPPEILGNLDKATLRSLCLTSKRCYGEALPKLYRHMPLSPVVHTNEGTTWRHLERAARTLLGSESTYTCSLSSMVTSLHVCWSARHPENHLVMHLVATLPNLSYLSLDFEHRGTGIARLPIEAIFSILERKPSLETLNLRFTEVDIQLEHLYVPACLRFNIHGLRSLRLKGVPTAALQQNFVHPLPKLSHLSIDYFDLPPLQLTAYIDMITAMSTLTELSLVDLEESGDTLAYLPDRFHGTLQRLTLDLDGASLNLQALERYAVLKHLQLGFTPFRGVEFKHLPPSLVSIQFHPGTLEQMLHLSAGLTSSRYLPKLRIIHLCGSCEAFWHGDDSQEDDWQLAKGIMSQFLAVTACRGISVEPPNLVDQLEDRRQRWRNTQR